MNTKKALLHALIVTVVSVVLLTITRGIPTEDQLIGGSVIMFLTAFVVMKCSKV